MNIVNEGVIRIEELASVIQSLHENPTREEMQEMMNEVDPDGDGTIDFEDFLNIMAKKLKVYLTISTRQSIDVMKLNSCTYILCTGQCNGGAKRSIQSI